MGSYKGESWDPTEVNHRVTQEVNHGVTQEVSHGVTQEVNHGVPLYTGIP